MSIFSNSLLELQKSLQNLPGIGEKTAQRLAYFIVNQPYEKSQKLANSVLNAIEKCKPCINCFLLSDTSPCPICSDEQRDDSVLCVVENSKDIVLIENTKEFQGKYFVLGRLLSPFDGIGPNEIRINELNRYLEKNNFKEIIIAIFPSVEGETTIQFIADHVNDKNINITRLSTGIPFGSDIEYTGSTTMLNAFRRRFPV